MSVGMRHRSVLLLLAITACGGDAVGGVTPLSPDSPAPAVIGANATVAATVGAALSYDATRGGNAFSSAVGATLTYSVAFEGPANGLTASRGTITGTPTAPGITFATITATDQLGRSARDRFAIVSFASGLPAPMLPSPTLRYDDAEVGLPAHFRAAVGGPSVLSLDNTPADEPDHRRGRDARTRALLRHAALGQRRGVVRILSPPVARLRRCARVQRRLRGAR